MVTSSWYAFNESITGLLVPRVLCIFFRAPGNRSFHHYIYLNTQNYKMLMPSELTSLRSMSHGECAQTTGTTPVLFDVDKLEWTSCNGHCQGLLTFVVLLRRAYVCHVRAYYKHPLRRGRSGTQPAKLVVIAQGLLKLAYIQGKGADTHCSSAIVLVLKALSGKYWICHYRFPAKHSLQTCH